MSLLTSGYRVSTVMVFLFIVTQLTLNKSLNHSDLGKFYCIEWHQEPGKINLQSFFSYCHMSIGSVACLQKLFLKSEYESIAYTCWCGSRREMAWIIGKTCTEDTMSNKSPFYFPT